LYTEQESNLHTSRQQPIRVALFYGFRRPLPPTDGRTAGAALLTVCEAAGVLTGVGEGVTVGAGVTCGLFVGFGDTDGDVLDD
jgi:hypothetical protein